MKFSVVSLGCKVNQSEGEDVKAGLSAAGLEPAGRGEPADVIVVNTCTVTGEADRKSRKAIYQAVKRRVGESARVVVTGCYAAVAAEELGRIPGVDLVVGQGEKASIVEEIMKHCSSSEGALATASRSSVLDSQARSNNNDDKRSDSNVKRARAFLKVQDGCDNRCSYCIVPDARGNPVSVPETEVLRRAGALAVAGAREIVLTGINVGKRDDLPRLIRKVMAVDGVRRVRLSSIEPEDVTLEVIGLMDNGLCPHLHVPLQSGDNRTLKRMGRRYTTGEFQHLVNSIKHANSDAAITTDLIVGFPGETEEEFANTLRFLEVVRPSRMHIFQYSRRAGTPAADMPDQVPETVKAARSRIARGLGEKLAAEYRDAFLGREVDVLVERVRDDVATGTSENYLAVSFDAAGIEAGTIVRHLL